MAVSNFFSSRYLVRTTDLPTAGADLSVTMWVYLASTASWQAALAFNTSGSYRYLGIVLTAARIGYTHGAGVVISGTTALSTNTWYGFGMTFNDSLDDTTLYLSTIDGAVTQEVQATEDTGAQTINSLRIGVDGNSGDGLASTSSRVACVKMWNRLLTIDELRSEFAQQVPADPTSLYGWWPLLTDTDFVDYSGNGRNWTEQGNLNAADAFPVPWYVRKRNRIFVAAGGTQFNQSASGSLTSAGALLKEPRLVLAGSLSSVVGALVRQAQVLKAGTLTGSGALLLQPQKLLTGSVASSGAVTGVRTVLQSVAGTLTSAGALAKETAKAFAGTVTSAGDLLKQAQKALAGTMTSSGALTAIKTALVSLSGTLTSAGALVPKALKGLAGTLSSSGALVKEMRRSLFGTIGGAGKCLRFYGEGNNATHSKVYVAFGDPSKPVNVGATDFTIEWWMKATSGVNTLTGPTAGANYSWVDGNIIIDRDTLGDNSFGDFGVSLDNERIAFGLENGSGSQRTIIGTIDVCDGAWHHVAVTRNRSNGDMAVYVDGTRDAFFAGGPSGDVHWDDNNPFPDTWDPYICFGGEKHALDAGQYNGFMDELRISKVLRYTGTSYSVPTAPFVSDSDTVALYHFDEGAGTTVGDTSGASGGPSNGTFTTGGASSGPTWEDSDCPIGTFEGSLSAIKTVLKSLSGSMTPAGALVAQARKALAGTLASVGAVVKEARKAFAGTLTSAGALAAIRTVLHSVAGTVTSAGSLSRQALKALTGTLSTSGAVSRLLSLSKAGALSVAGSLVKQTRISMAGALSFAGAVVGQIVGLTSAAASRLFRVGAENRTPAAGTDGRTFPVGPDARTPEVE